MDLPKCQRCGTRLTLSAFDRYDGFCHDCYSHKQGQQVETLLLVLLALFTLVLLLLTTGAGGFF
jgi:recombinational DNA repair protein (RecF pathway)